MRPRTVDLLRIRDGEPVDATVRLAVDADPRLSAELARLSDVRRELAALPPLEPPPHVWTAIEARLAQQRARRPAAGAYWVLRGALAAAVAIAAIAYLLRAPSATVDDLPATIVGNPSAQQSSPAFGAAAYASLVARSAELERALDDLGRRSPVVRAGTAATVASLEGRIDAIDTGLTFARQLGLENAAIADLHRQRVELLNALVQVRYAEQLRYVDAPLGSEPRPFGY